MAQHSFQAGDLIRYIAGKEIVEAKVFRTCAGKLWIDHRTFSRARIVRQDSSNVLGLAL